MVKIGGSKKRKLSKKVNWTKIGRKFINVAKIGRGKFINLVEIRWEICNMHHWLRGMDPPNLMQLKDLQQSVRLGCISTCYWLTFVQAVLIVYELKFIFSTLNAQFWQSMFLLYTILRTVPTFSEQTRQFQWTNKTVCDELTRQFQWTTRQSQWTNKAVSVNKQGSFSDETRRFQCQSWECLGSRTQDFAMGRRAEGVSIKYYCIYNVQEYEMKIRSKVVTFHKDCVYYIKIPGWYPESCPTCCWTFRTHDPQILNPDHDPQF